MAHKKGGGSTRNGRGSNAQHRGVKRFGGEYVSAGTILVRQVGQTISPGRNVDRGRDFTLYALQNGIVRYEHESRTKLRVSVYSMQYPPPVRHSVPQRLAVSQKENSPNQSQPRSDLPGIKKAILSGVFDGSGVVPEYIELDRWYREENSTVKAQYSRVEKDVGLRFNKALSYRFARSGKAVLCALEELRVVGLGATKLEAVRESLTALRSEAYRAVRRLPDELDSHQRIRRRLLLEYVDPHASNLFELKGQQLWFVGVFRTTEAGLAFYSPSTDRYFYSIPKDEPVAEGANAIVRMQLDEMGAPIDEILEVKALPFNLQTDF